MDTVKNDTSPAVAGTGDSAAQQHTPGWRVTRESDGGAFDEWDLRAPGNCIYYKIVEAGDVAAIVCGGTERAAKRRKNLIIAAPDLKREVGRMVSVLENIIPRLQNVHAIMARELETDLARLNAALAKATS